MRRVAMAQADAIVHRGPDSGDVYVEPALGVALAHRRLAIIDLSAAGYQPMVSSDGDFVIVYNGEIYNAEQTRQELIERGISFRGHSDTEVLLEACVAFGVEQAIKRFIGMFAFAILDKKNQRLTVVRDRLGIKPLFYSFAGNHFLFGSELKALVAHPQCPKDIDHDGVAAYFRYQYIPTPHSIYQGVKKLPQGQLLEIDLTKPDARPAPRPFWSFDEVAHRGLANQTTGSDKAVVDEFDSLLVDAVKRRMIADVPLGVFLSGGVDSSTVVALMQEASSKPIRTFSIGFDESQYNEAVYAAEIAKHLGTDHTELYVSPQQALDVIPNLTDMYDEPYADSSQIPTFLVSEMTRKHVTVALSGDGGDELVAGYNRYHAVLSQHRRPESMPKRLKHMVANGARRAGLWPQTASMADSKFARTGVMPEEQRRQIWRPEYQSLIKDTRRRFDDHFADVSSRESLNSLQAFDLESYIPYDNLTKVDIASMYHGLEVRVPLLDHVFMETAAQVPPELKLCPNSGNGNGRLETLHSPLNVVGKHLLKRNAEQFFSRNFLHREKRGFEVPIRNWFAGPHRNELHDRLTGQNSNMAKYFQPESIDSLVAAAGEDKVAAWKAWSLLVMDEWMIQEKECLSASH